MLDGRQGETEKAVYGRPRDLYGVRDCHYVGLHANSRINLHRRRRLHNRRAALRVHVPCRRTCSAVTQTVARAADGSDSHSGWSARVQADRPVRGSDQHGRRYVRPRKQRSAQHCFAAGQTTGGDPVTANSRDGHGGDDGGLQTKTIFVRLRRRMAGDADRRQKTAHRLVVVAVFGRRRRWSYSAGRLTQPVPLDAQPSPRRRPTSPAAHRDAQPHNTASPAVGRRRFWWLLENARRTLAGHRRPRRPAAVHHVVHNRRRRDHLLQWSTQSGRNGRNFHAQVPQVFVVRFAATVCVWFVGQKAEPKVTKKTIFRHRRQRYAIRVVAV